MPQLNLRLFIQCVKYDKTLEQDQYNPEPKKHSKDRKLSGTSRDTKTISNLLQ